eukprot:4501185-Pyramimonas_sp.AAC.1
MFWGAPASSAAATSPLTPPESRLPQRRHACRTCLLKMIIPGRASETYGLLGVRAGLGKHVCAPTYMY